MNPENLVKIA